jgi:hypothetical protein
MWDKWGGFLIKGSKFMCIDQRLLSLHLPEAITFDLRKLIAHWKSRDEKNTLELVSMVES